jgi:GT2 family glycosyltransferase
MLNSTAVVVNFNGLHFLKKNLPSLFEQSFPFSTILIVDNNSQDGSKEFLDTFPFLLKIVLKKNQGFAPGANRGIAFALRDPSCQAIALVNNDVWLDKGWLMEAQRVLLLNDRVGSCSTLLLQASQPQQVDTAGIHWPYPGLADNYLHGKPLSSAPDHPVKISGACAAAALYRREFFEDVGLFDESLFAYQEDVDLSLRGTSKGWHCFLAPKALGYHHGLGSNRAFPGGGTWADFYNARNRITVLVQALPGEEWRQHGRLIVGGQARLLVRSFKEGRGPAVSYGMLMALWTLRRTWGKRKRLMADINPGGPDVILKDRS